MAIDKQNQDTVIGFLFRSVHTTPPLRSSARDMFVVTTIYTVLVDPNLVIIYYFLFGFSLTARTNISLCSGYS